MKRLRLGLAVMCCVSSAAVAAAAAPAPGPHVKLMRSDTVLAADGSSVTTVHAENEAVNAGAVMSVGQTALMYLTANQTLDIVEAYTRKADGKKIPVDVSAIYDQLPPAAGGAPVFTDAHIKTIVFPQFAIGDTAVYTARITTKHAIFPGQFWTGEIFLPQIAFDDVEETLTAPSTLALHFENHGVAFEKTSNGAETVYRWHFSAPASAAQEMDFTTPLAQVPHYFVSTFPDYAAIGRAYASAAAPATAVTPAIQALADNITKGTHGRRDEARALYAWVAGHIRYVAVELGKGTLVPHPADTVLSNGYGDCKDHVALLEALLKARGIASEAVLLNATIIYELSEAPTFAGLDHVITFIPSLNVYLDSTAAVAPFGVLPFSEYGKPAIYASETAPRMGVMPVLPAGLASVTTKTVTHLDKDGVLSGTTVTTAAGPYSIALRAEGLGIQALGSEASAKRLLSATGQGSDASGTLDAPPPTEMSDSYTVSGSFTEKGWSSQLAGTQEFYLPGGMRLLGLSGDGPMGPLGSATLKPDVTLPCYSAEATEDLSLEAPAGAQFSNVPADTHVKSANVRFDAHWTLANSTIGVHRHFVSAIDRPLCTAAIRAANSQALKAILDSYNVSLSFEPPGKPPQDAWYASDIANPPKDPKLAAMLEDGLAAMHRHDDVAAIAKFSAILAEHDLPISASFPARFDRAALYARNWRYEDALADLNAALVLTPGDTRMLASRAFVYFSQADFSRSLADCQTVLGQDPADAFALQLRANTEMETGKYADAVRDYTSVLRISATPNALVLRAVAYHQLGRESDSAGDIAQAEAKGDDSAKGDYAEIVGATRAGDVARKSTNAVVIQDAHPASGADVPALNSHTAEWPPLSGRLQETGRLRVDFTIEPDGHVDEPRIEKSCGFARLDTASLEAVKTWRYTMANPSLRISAPRLIGLGDSLKPWTAVAQQLSEQANSIRREALMGYVIFGDRRSGAFSVEAALAEAGQEFEFRDVSLERNEQLEPAFLAISATGKMPALLLPDGETLTESLAMLITVAERHPDAGLLPPMGSNARAQAYRWLAFMASEIYPMIEIVDYPARFVPQGPESDALREKARERVRARILLLEAAIVEPWLLPTGFSVADIYAAMFSRWDIGREWRDAHCPKLTRLAQALAERPRVAPVWQRHFGKD